MKQPVNAALILSGGSGKRMGIDVPKQYLELLGKPVVVHTVEQFQRCELIRYVAIAAAEEWREQILRWKAEFRLTKLQAVAPAGTDRQGSILNGLRALQPLLAGADDGVVVQDAVRPLTSDGLIKRLLDGLREAPCVLPVLPVTDTTYTSRDGQWVDGLLERSTLYSGQAPEAFRYQDYLHLYGETPAKELSAMSGSCQLPYSRRWKVKMVPGERDNIKITYLSDLQICEKLLREREIAR